VSAVLGTFTCESGRKLVETRSFLTASSVLYDAVLVPGGAESIATLRSIHIALEFVLEAFLHAKPIGATNEGLELLAAAELPGIELASAGKRTRLVSDHGVVTALAETPEDLALFAVDFIDALRQHRHFERAEQMWPDRRTTRKQS
jgi:catalase